MRDRTRLRWRALGLLAVLALVAVACGDDSTSTTTAAGQSTTTTAAQATKPIIVMAGSDTVNLVEPHTFRSTTAYDVTQAVYEPLITQEPIDRGGWFQGSRESHIAAGAESYTIDLTDAGGMLATFNLRHDAKFSNGDPVTAEDYKYTFQRSIEGPGYIGVLLPFIGISSADQLTVIDDFTFQVETTVQSPLFERFLTFQVFGAINQKLVDANSTADDPWGFVYLNDKSAGSGPYYISDFSPDTQVVLTPNENYWDAANVANAGVVIRTVPDANQRAQLVRTGEIDIAAGIPERLLPELATDPNVKIFEIPTTGVNYLAINVNLVPNVDVRRAIVKAVPYQALIDQVMFGYAAPAGGVVTSNMETYDATVGAGYSTSLDDARNFLAASGETDVSLVLGVRESRANDQEAAVLIQENLRQIGITVDVQVLPDADWAAKASAGELPLLIHDWFSWGEDPFYQMKFLSTCGSFVNYSGWCNEAYDAAVTRGEFSVDPGVRQAASSEAQQMFYDDAVWAPLWSTTRTLVTGKCVTGVELGYSLVPDYRHVTKSDTC